MAVAPVQTVHKVRTQVTTPAVTTTIAITGVAAGALLVMVGAWFEGNAEVITGITDTRSNGWNGVTIRSGDANSHIQIWYAMNCAAGDTTITITFSNDGALDATFEGDLLEFSSAATTLALDKDIGATGTGDGSPNPVVVTSGTLAQADEVIIAIVSHTGADATITHDTGDGFTQISENEDNDLGQTYNSQRLIVAATTSIDANWTFNANRTWFASLASFKGAAVAGGAAIRPCLFTLMGVGT